MCQVAVYLDREKIADSVIWIEPVGEEIQIKTLFDEPLYVKGTLKSIDLIKNRVNIISGRDTGSSE